MKKYIEPSISIVNFNKENIVTESIVLGTLRTTIDDVEAESYGATSYTDIIGTNQQCKRAADRLPFSGKERKGFNEVQKLVGGGLRGNDLWRGGACRRDNRHGKRDGGYQ